MVCGIIWTLLLYLSAPQGYSTMYILLYLRLRKVIANRLPQLRGDYLLHEVLLQTCGGSSYVYLVGILVLTFPINI